MFANWYAELNLFILSTFLPVSVGVTLFFIHPMNIINSFILKTITKFFIYLMITMGWLQVVGSFKLLISFAESRLFYRALLQKRPVI